MLNIPIENTIENKCLSSNKTLLFEKANKKGIMREILDDLLRSADC
jgi:hypothetical protein